MSDDIVYVISGNENIVYNQAYPIGLDFGE